MQEHEQLRGQEASGSSSKSTLLIECINERGVDDDSEMMIGDDGQVNKQDAVAAESTAWVQHFDLYQKNDSKFVRHLGKNYWNITGQSGNTKPMTQRRLLLNLGGGFDSLPVDVISEKYFVVVGLTDLNNRPKRSNVTLNFKTNTLMARRTTSSSSLDKMRYHEGNYTG